MVGERGCGCFDAFLEPWVAMLGMELQFKQGKICLHSGSYIECVDEIDANGNNLDQYLVGFWSRYGKLRYLNLVQSLIKVVHYDGSHGAHGAWVEQPWAALWS